MIFIETDYQSHLIFFTVKETYGDNLLLWLGTSMVRLRT